MEEEYDDAKFKYYRPDALTVADMALIPANETMLDLSHSPIVTTDLTFDTIIEILTAIPGHIINLDFSGHKLGALEIDQILAIFAAMPAGLKTIILSNNQLDLQSSENIGLIVNSIPAAAEYIGVALNNLATKPVVELVQLAGCIRENIKGIDIAKNGLEAMPPQNLQSFVENFPASVEVVGLNEEVFNTAPDFRDFYYNFDRCMLVRFKDYENMAMAKSRGFFDSMANNLSANIVGLVESRILSFLNAQDVSRMHCVCWPTERLYKVIEAQKEVEAEIITDAQLEADIFTGLNLPNATFDMLLSDDEEEEIGLNFSVSRFKPG